MHKTASDLVSGSVEADPSPQEPRALWEGALITVGGLATVLWSVFLGWAASHTVVWFLGLLATTSSG